MSRFSGFTLLEVMVSMAILALAVSTLLVVRNDTIKQAARAIELRRVRMFLEQKMGEISAGLEKSTSGNFSKEGHIEYTWRASVTENRFKSSPDPEGKVHEVVLKKVVVTVFSQTGYNKTVEAYFLAKRPEDVEEK